MPNTQTAKKALRQNIKRRLENRTKRSALKTSLKKARTAIVAGEGDSAEILKAAVKKLDQTASKGLIHKNTASRLKSRLAKLVKAKEAGAAK